MSLIYQTLSPIYLFRKYIRGKKKLLENDVKKLNLKGKVKTYQNIKENIISTEINFNEFGFITSKYENNDTKIYDYISDTNLLLGINTYLGHEISFENLISEEFFHYNKSFSKLLFKKTQNYKFSKFIYIDKFCYDIRGNLIAIINYRGSIKKGSVSKVVIKTYDMENNEIAEKIYYDNKSKNIMRISQIGSTSIRNVENYFYKVDQGYELISNMTEIIDENKLVISSESFALITGTLNTKVYYNFDKYGNWVSKIEDCKVEIRKRIVTNREKIIANIEYW